MIISSQLLTLGKSPDVKFTSGGMMCLFPAAENQRRNVGTEDKPDWETVNTSWFDMVAFGDTAQEIVDQLEKGDAFRLVRGYHSWKNIGTKEEPDYRPSYRVVEFEKVEKKNKND